MNLLDANVVVNDTKRLFKKDGTSGIFKFSLQSVEEKKLVLQAKTKPRRTKLNKVDLRSSKPLSERIQKSNLRTIMSKVEWGKDFRISANGRLLPKSDFNNNMAGQLIQAVDKTSFNGARPKSSELIPNELQPDSFPPLLSAVSQQIDKYNLRKQA